MEYIVGDIRFKDQNEALEYERKLKFADYLSKTRCYVVKYDESYGLNKMFCFCSSDNSPGELFNAFRQKLFLDAYDVDERTGKFKACYTVTRLGKEETRDVFLKFGELPPRGVSYKNVEGYAGIFVNACEMVELQDEPKENTDPYDCSTCECRGTCPVSVLKTMYYKSKC